LNSGIRIVTLQHHKCGADLSDTYYVDTSAPISQTVTGLTDAIIRDWGVGKSAVLVRTTKRAKARKRPDTKIVIEEDRDNQGRLHCETGPALKVFLPGSEYPVLNAHFLAGRAHSLSGTCVTQHDPETNLTTRIIYGQNDRIHRRWGPAFTETLPAKSEVSTRQAWMWRGKLHHVSGPALVNRDADRKRAVFAEWHVYGMAVLTMDLRSEPKDYRELCILTHELSERGTFPKCFGYADIHAWRRERHASTPPSIQGGPA
jgi:hypothetical protein